MQYSDLHIAEPFLFIAKVPSHNPYQVRDEIADALASFAMETCYQDGKYAFMFERGSAMLRAVAEHLLIEVEACDCVTCHGIKATIGGLLVGTISELPPELLWVPKKHFSN